MILTGIYKSVRLDLDSIAEVQSRKQHIAQRGLRSDSLQGPKGGGNHQIALTVLWTMQLAVKAREATIKVLSSYFRNRILIRLSKGGVQGSGLTTNYARKEGLIQ
jgi:hypothetical protein